MRIIPGTSNSAQELTFTWTYHGQLNFESYLQCGCNLILHPFYSEPRSYLDAEKNHYARIADSDHNSYFSPRVNGLP